MCRYGRMVKADPKKSYVYGVKFPFISDTSHDDLLKLEFTKRHKISLGICAFTVLFFAWGAITRGWYFSELSAIFIVMMLVVGFVNNMSVGQTCDAFVKHLQRNTLRGLRDRACARNPHRPPGRVR